VLKPVNEIRFIVRLKYESSTIMLFVSIRYSVLDLLSDLNNHAKLMICVRYGIWC